MRFVVAKSDEASESAMVLQALELLLRQRTQLINAVRVQLRVLGLVVPQGAGDIRKLDAIVDSCEFAIPNVTPGVP